METKIPRINLYDYFYSILTRWGGWRHPTGRYSGRCCSFRWRQLWFWRHTSPTRETVATDPKGGSAMEGAHVPAPQLRQLRHWNSWTKLPVVARSSMATTKWTSKRRLNTNKTSLPEELKRVKWPGSNAPTVSAAEWLYRYVGRDFSTASMHHHFLLLLLFFSRASQASLSEC